jgi:hypothetical protein
MIEGAADTLQDAEDFLAQVDGYCYLDERFGSALHKLVSAISTRCVGPKASHRA